MKSYLILAFFLFTTLAIFAQTESDTSFYRERLKKELVKYNKVETWCQGYSCNSISKVYRTADSLFGYCNLSDALTYLNDSSYPLKYYSFLYILGQNDSLGFEILMKYASDTHYVNASLSDLIGQWKFNSLLVKSYKHFIEWKYLVGGKVLVFEHVKYSFPPKDTKAGKKKLRQLNKLTERYGILGE